jgi:hypothetical protein
MTSTKDRPDLENIIISVDANGDWFFREKGKIMGAYPKKDARKHNSMPANPVKEL